MGIGFFFFWGGFRGGGLGFEGWIGVAEAQPLAPPDTGGVRVGVWVAGLWVWEYGFVLGFAGVARS